MRTVIHYHDRRRTPNENVAAALALRDSVFPVLRIPRHKIKWVSTSSAGGYWTL